MSRNEGRTRDKLSRRDRLELETGREVKGRVGT
jgi:hypothetical protein